MKVTEKLHLIVTKVLNDADAGAEVNLVSGIFSDESG